MRFAFLETGLNFSFELEFKILMTVKSIQLEAFL